MPPNNIGGLSFLTSCSGLRCPFRRGNANNGTNAGLAYLNGNNAVSNANVNWSSPLRYAADLLVRSGKETLSLDKKSRLKV